MDKKRPQQEWKELMRDSLKDAEKRKADLEARSKKLEDLIVTEKFTVDEVLVGSYPTSFTPSSEMRIGGRSPVYTGGFWSKITLKVTPENSSVPVKTLIFDGFSTVRAGDYVSVRIPKYAEERVYSGDFYKQEKVFYLERDFNAEESAIELAILSGDKKVLRTERAVSYRHFSQE